MSDEPITLTDAERNAMKDPPPTRRERVVGFLKNVGYVLSVPFILLGMLFGSIRAAFRRPPRRPLFAWQKKQRQEKWVVGIFWVTGACVIAILIFGFYKAYFETETMVDVTVQKTERVSYGSGDNIQHMYLVYTDHGTFKCTDSLVYGKFNSSDVYGSLQQGHRYRMRVVGWRSGFFTMYPNIIEAHQLP